MKHFVRLLVLGALLAGGTARPARAQQQAQYSQYMNNNFLLNPAVAGTEEFIDVKFSHRTQWLGLEGAPSTFYATVHSSLGKPVRRTLQQRRRRFHALGGTAYSDVTGPTRRTGLYLCYAYNLALTRKLRLALGVSGGLQQFAVNGDELRFHDAETVRGFQSALAPDASIGLWMYTPDFYVGASTGQILGTPLGFEYYQFESSSQRNVLQRHYYLTGGLRVPLNREWTLVPSALLRYTATSSPSVDLSAKFRYKRLLSLGASWRAFDSAIATFGINLTDNLTLNYTYDLGTSELAKYHGGSHEVVVGLRLKKKGKVREARFW